MATWRRYLDTANFSEKTIVVRKSSEKMSTVTYLFYCINYIIMVFRIFLEKYIKIASVVFLKLTISCTKTTLAIFFKIWYNLIGYPFRPALWKLLQNCNSILEVHIFGSVHASGYGYFLFAYFSVWRTLKNSQVIHAIVETKFRMFGQAVSKYMIVSVCVIC
jgi:hypothetical protein